MLNKLAAFVSSVRRHDAKPAEGKADGKRNGAPERETGGTQRTSIRDRSVSVVDSAIASAVSVERAFLLDRLAGDFVAVAVDLSWNSQTGNDRANTALSQSQAAFTKRFGHASSLSAKEHELLAEKLIELSIRSIGAGESRASAELAMTTLVRWAGPALDHARLADLLVDARPGNRDYVCAVLQPLTTESDRQRLAPALLRLHASQGGEAALDLLSSVLPRSLDERATALTACVQQLAPKDVSVNTIDDALRMAQLNPDRKAHRRADVAMQLAAVCAAIRPMPPILSLRAMLGNDVLRVQMEALQRFAYVLGSELTPARLEAVVTALSDAARDETSGSPEAIAALPEAIAACVSPKAPPETSLLAAQLKAKALAAPSS